MEELIHRQSTAQEERKEGTPCSVEYMRRPSIKLPTIAPTIMICVPVGAKAERRIFEVPKCSDPECKCSNHGKQCTTVFHNQGLVPVEWAISLNNLVTPLNTTIGYLVEKGRLSSEARNRMTERTLEAGSKYIYFMDDDVVPHPHMLYAAHNILERNPDIGLVTGVYCTRESPTEPFIYQKQGDGAWWGFSIDPDSPPEDIYGCGGGCILARCEDVAKMTKPYWTDEQIVHDSHSSTWGHDIRFVKKFREESGKRTVVKGHLLGQHFDVDQNRSYVLPEDSLPYQKLRNTKNLPRNSRWAEVQMSPKLTVEYVDNQLGYSHGLRRMFVVAKEVQSDEEMRQVLSQRFKKSSIHSMDDQWLAVCEELIKENGDAGS